MFAMVAEFRLRTGDLAAAALADLTSGGRHILRVDDLVDHSGQCREPAARQDYRSHHAPDEPRGRDCHRRLRAGERAAQLGEEALSAILASGLKMNGLRRNKEIRCRL